MEFMHPYGTALFEDIRKILPAKLIFAELESAKKSMKRK